MLTIQPGTVLQSSEQLDDPIFSDTRLLIVRADHNGCIGFILNRPFPRSLHELVEFSQFQPWPLWYGGPVGAEELFFLHRCPQFATGAEVVQEGLYLGGDFQQAMVELKQQVLSKKDIRLFIGYAGWDYGELEEEIQQGYWMIQDTTDLNW
ncbi:MAG: YqgE/AlgH family protein [Chitinophagaceae bacterium]|nr:YqgE/AlgH family protein [Chitinophagaceae bacterium]